MKLEEEIKVLNSLKVLAAKDTALRVLPITEKEFILAMDRAFNGTDYRMVNVLTHLKHHNIIRIKEGTKPYNTMKNLLLDRDTLNQRNAIVNQKSSTGQAQV